MNTRAFTILLLLIGLQGLDVFVHVAVGQVETMRVVSNVIISVGAVASVFALTHSKTVIFLAGFVYLALNFLFLVQHGIVNPNTNALRLPLFVFVAVSLFLLTWLTRNLMNRHSGN